MAQYDLLLIQNTAAEGTEYSEKFVNIAKGGLLSGATGGVPTVLAAGTDGYHLVRDDNETTGLKWVAIDAGHTQGTDTGTTNTSFTIDSDSTVGKIIIDPTDGAADLSLTLTNATLTDTSKTITFPNTTGTVALTSDLHTQHTDTGTTSTVFELDSDGYKIELTAESASKLGVKVDGGSTYADLQAKDITCNDLTVNGTTTTINSTTLTVDDKNIELGSVASPTDTTADGGGITLKGATDKTILWDNTNDNWSFNQAVNLENGLTYKINNTTVLSSTQVLGVTLGTMAAATATDYIAKSLLTEQGDIIYASAASTPAALAHGNAGQVLQSGGNGANPSWLTLGTMAAETATNYVTKALYDANTILYATSDDTPAALTVGEQTIVGRVTSGAIDALTDSEVMGVLWQSAPATKGASGIAGQIAKDTNYIYICTATDTWKRAAIATNW